MSEGRPKPTVVSALNARYTGHELVADALRQCGISHVIGISGTPVDRIFPACAERNVRPIGTRHQSAAVLMAAASNFIGGRLGSAVVVSAGPAVTNTLTGVLVARNNGWPVIVMGGRRPVQGEGSGYFQELDAVPIFRSVAKFAAKVERVSDLVPAVMRAYETAVSGRPGPVYLDLPEDVLRAHASETHLPSPCRPPVVSADARLVAEAAHLLNSSRRPLLILGEDVRWSLDPVMLRDLVERHEVPFITAPLARGFLPDDHRLCANAVRHWIPAQADLVLMVGAWFDWRFRFGAEVAPHASVIHVGIESATLGRNVPRALTIHADGGRFLEQLDVWLRPLEGRGEERAPWIQCMTAARDAKITERQSWTACPSQPMSPQRLFGELRAVIPRDAIVALDGNVTLSTGQAILSASAPASWLDPGWDGCMGSGIPMAIGAKLAAPNRLVVAVCGDFGFGLSAMELNTAARHDIPVVVVVANNDGATGATRQIANFGRDYAELFSRYQADLRYERIAEALGCGAEYVSDASGVAPAFERAAASRLPVCINVHVDPYAPHPGSW